MKSIIVLSGGLDSATVLADYMENNKENPIAINFGYGSKHQAKEQEACKKLCEHYGIELITMDLDFSVLDSALLKADAQPIPEGHYEDSNMQATVVPFRNGIMLSYAIAIAESKGAEEVLIGAHNGDHAIYPDCRLEFISAINCSAVKGTYNKIRVHAPFVDFDKARIVEIGAKAELPFELTWTCYNGREKACGKCGSCVERLEAFEKNGIKDPVEYEEQNDTSN